MPRRSPTSPLPPQHTAPHIGRSLAPSTTEWLLLGASALVVLLRIAFTFLPVELRLWGIDFSRYVADDPIILAMLVLPLAALVPRWGSAFGAAGEGRTIPPMIYWPLAVVLALGAGWIGMQVHMIFALYGDGALYQTEIIRMLAAPDAPSSLVKPTAWLSGMLLTGLTRALQPDDARIPYVIMGALSLTVMVVGMLALTRGMRRREAVVLVAPLVLSAGLLLHFGYVELYALPFALSVLHLVAIWRAVRENASLVPAGVLLALAAAAGATALVFVPAYIAAWLLRSGDAARARAQALTMAPGTAVVVVAAVSTFGTNLWNPLILPITAGNMITAAGVNEGPFAYTLFSGAHLVDVVNILLLFAAPALAVLLVSIPWMRRNGTAHPLFVHAWVLVTSAVAALLVGYAYFGLARDWDAMAIPMLALPFAASAVLTLRADLGTRMRGTIVLAYVVASAAGGVLWLRMNTLPAAAERFEDILVMDASQIAPQRSFTGWESLRKYRAHTGDIAGEDRALRSMAETGWNRDATWRRILGRGMEDSDAQARQARFSFLLEQFDRVLESPAPESDYRHIPPKRLRELLASVLIAMRYRGDAQSARAQLAAWTPRVAEWRERPFVEAVLDEGRPMASKADVAAACVDTFATDPVLLSTAGDHLVAAGRHAEAARLFERAIAVEPGAWPAVYLRLARLYDAALRDPAAALRVLERCADECLLFEGRGQVLEAIEVYRTRLAQ